jgi:hypothetical protein
MGKLSSTDGNGAMETVLKLANGSGDGKKASKASHALRDRTGTTRRTTAGS